MSKQQPEPPDGIDFSDPQVCEMVKEAWRIVARARARRLAREASAQQQEEKRSA